MNFKHVLLSIFLLLTPLLISGGVYVIQSNTNMDHPDDHWSKLKEKIDFQIHHFPGTAGILIKDLKRGWIIEYNSEKLFPSASLVKIPLMAAVYHAQVKGRISLEEALPIEKRLKVGGSGTLRFKRTGTLMTVRQLVFKMITESDNTATNILADFFGLEYYNSYFQSVGLKRTNFSRMIMDLKKRDQGVENYTTPRDMATILEKIYDKKLTGSDEMLEILKSQKINDRLAIAIPSGWQIGHKTGLMRNSCHDVGIVFASTSDYVICVLTKDIRNFRRAKNFISVVSHLTASYYGDPSQHPAPKKSFWSKFWTSSSIKTRSG